MAKKMVDVLVSVRALAIVTKEISVEVEFDDDKHTNDDIGDMAEEKARSYVVDMNPEEWDHIYVDDGDLTHCKTVTQGHPYDA